MAYELIKIGNSYNRPIKLYYCKSYSELANLDANFGDRVTVFDDEKTYIKGSDGWYPFSGEGYSGYRPPHPEAVDEVDIQTEGEYEGNLVFNEKLYLNADDIGQKYSLITQTGKKVEMELDDQFVLTLKLENNDETVLSQAQIDLPIESLVSDLTYDATTKEIVITLHGGVVRRIPVTDLANRNAYTTIEQLEDYLFETTYSRANIDYSYGNEYFRSTTTDDEIAAGCTGVILNGRVLRQLDWYYGDEVEFLVRTAAEYNINNEKTIHASIGLCSGIKTLTKSAVEKQTYNKKYGLVPLVITDGMNDAGLYIQSNVVPSTYSDGTAVNYNINPNGSTECCVALLCRYILDYCGTIAEVENVLNTVHIFGTSKVNYGYHFLVAQGDEWEIIELKNDGWEKFDSTTAHFPVMTNFRMAANIVSEAGAVSWSNIEPYGLGVERFETGLRAHVGSARKTLEELRTALTYTKMYTDENHSWKTEFCGEEGTVEGVTRKLTVMDAQNYPDAFTPIFTSEIANYNARTRADGKDTWQTIHSSIYDLSAKTLNLTIQERNSNEKNFLFDTTKSEIGEVQKEVETKQDELISGTNIKTISGQSLLGSGDLEITSYTVTLDV